MDIPNYLGNTDPHEVSSSFVLPIWQNIDNRVGHFYAINHYFI
jgi:hypothetical protein